MNDRHGAINEMVATLWSTQADTYPEDVYAGGTAITLIKVIQAATEQYNLYWTKSGYC